MSRGAFLILGMIGGLVVAELLAMSFEAAASGDIAGAGTRINVERARQALATGAEAVVTECPFCMPMIRDGLNDSSEAAPMATLDLAELLAGGLVGGTSGAAPGAAASTPQLPVH